MEETIARGKEEDDVAQVLNALHEGQKVGDMMGRQKHIRVKEGEARKPGWLYFVKGQKHLAMWRTRMARGAKRGHR